MARKVLLVDDSKSARYAIGLLLKKQGFEVENAGSAEQAMEAVRQKQPDAIFLDHQLPGMNGLDLLVMLRGDLRDREIPVVMCTSNDSEEYAQEAREKGALDVLCKPDAPRRIAEIAKNINELLDARETAPREQVFETTINLPDQPVAAAPVPTSPTEKAISQLEIDMSIATAMQTQLDPILQRRLQDFQEQMRPIVERYAMESLSHEMAVLSHQVRDDLKEFLNEKMQAAGAKLVQQTVPAAIKVQLTERAQQISDQMDKRFEALAADTVRRLPRDPQVAKLLKSIAESAANTKAEQVARKLSTELAEQVATERATQITSIASDSADRAVKSMRLLAMIAVGVSVTISLALHFLL